MERYTRTNLPGPIPAKHGAALIYALVAVLIIAVLALGVGRMVSFHATSENTAQGYARAIYVAEAAASWQLGRMSRSNLPGTPNNIQGRLAWEAVNTWNEGSNKAEAYVGALPGGELGTAFDGTAKVWVSNASGNGKLWTAPDDFYLYSIGADPKTGIQRGIAIRGTGTGLADNYALFAQNELMFESMPLASGSKGVCTIKTGYIGANGRVAFNTAGAPPDARPPSLGNMFYGCRLGPNAVLQPPAGNWTSGWDIPRLPDIARWPTIDDVITYVWRGRSIAQAATVNDNVEIQYRTMTGTFLNFPTPPTRLTNAEFNQSNSTPYRTIRIRAKVGAPNHNLIYLENIHMRDDDVLILDLRKEVDNDTPSGIRILINNNNLGVGNAPLITNLAYFETQDSLADGDQISQRPTYIWYNNTNQPLTFRPNLAKQELVPPLPVEEPHWIRANYRYRLYPALRGLIYGISAVAAPDAGKVIVEGDPSRPAGGASIQSVVANRVLIRGKVSANNAVPVESEKDRNRYILNYRVQFRPYGEILTNLEPSATSPTERGSPYNYGPFSP